MPGVLFHHVTPTMDYYMPKLQEWVHYIPVETNLNDLRKKFEWARNHPEEAQTISRAGTEYVEWIGSVDGFEAMYAEYLVDPLRNFIDAYKPIKGGGSILEAINMTQFNIVILSCSGLPEMWEEEQVKLKLDHSYQTKHYNTKSQ